MLAACLKCDRDGEMFIIEIEMVPNGSRIVCVSIRLANSYLDDRDISITLKEENGLTKIIIMELWWNIPSYFLLVLT